MNDEKNYRAMTQDEANAAGIPDSVGLYMFEPGGSVLSVRTGKVLNNKTGHVAISGTKFSYTVPVRRILSVMFGDETAKEAFYAEIEKRKPVTNVKNKGRFMTREEADFLKMSHLIDDYVFNIMGECWDVQKGTRVYPAASGRVSLPNRQILLAKVIAVMFTDALSLANKRITINFVNGDKTDCRVNNIKASPYKHKTNPLRVPVKRCVYTNGRFRHVIVDYHTKTAPTRRKTVSKKTV